MSFFWVTYSEHRQLLEKCAATTLSSKLVAHQKDFFAKMVVDAVMLLDELLPLNMIGVKKVTGGGLEVRDFIVFILMYDGELWEHVSDLLVFMQSHFLMCHLNSFCI